MMAGKMDVKITPSIASPYTARGASSPRATETATAGDGYAGSVGLSSEMLRAELNPAHQHSSRGWAMAGLAALGVAGALMGHPLSAAAQEAVPPATSICTPVETAAAAKVQLSAYMDPARPEPDNAQVSTDIWVNSSSQIFSAYKNADTDALVHLASPEGVWVRGLPGEVSPTGMVHMTHDEFAKDVHQKGTFYQHVFQNHANARFTIAPDNNGLLRTILLD